MSYSGNFCIHLYNLEWFEVQLRDWFIEFLGKDSINTYLNLDLESHNETISTGTKARREEFQYVRCFLKNVNLP